MTGFANAWLMRDAHFTLIDHVLEREEARFTVRVKT